MVQTVQWLLPLLATPGFAEGREVASHTLAQGIGHYLFRLTSQLKRTHLGATHVALASLAVLKGYIACWNKQLYTALGELEPSLAHAHGPGEEQAGAGRLVGACSRVLCVHY